MRDRPEVLGQALRDYVRGDLSEPILFGQFKGVPKEEVDRLLTDHRAELERIDPARSVILVSIIDPFRRARENEATNLTSRNVS